ncbi:MAG: hypothetical protein JWL65_7582, partial [Gammaproteobacteria bacterium]|nr:hypothetical protein [Gammaproteobacteria bacterium]
MTPRFLYALCASILLWAANAQANAAVRASVDNTQVAPGDPVELTLSHDGQTGSQPDLSPLKQDFDIVGSNSTRRAQIVNGKISSTTELQLSLAPKHAGPLTIPSITWDSDRSAPLTLVVSAAGAGANGTARGAADNGVLLETEVDPKSPYLQGAVHVTVHIYAAVPLSRANLEFPTNDEALVRQVGADENGVSQKNGQSYQVVTRHYGVFPQHSGHLSIPGPVLTGTVPVRMRRSDPNDPFSGFFSGSPFGGMLGGSKPIRLNGEPIVLDVLPRPAGAGTNYWLPAQNVTLSARWRPTDLQAHVGDPVTVNLQLQAEDLTAAQLPDLSALLTLPPGIKAYPDEPKLTDSAKGTVILGVREQNIALIADQPGQFTIPELRLTWWDVRSNQAREAVLPARTVVVQPSASSKNPTPVATLPGSSTVAASQPNQTAQSAETAGGSKGRAGASGGAGSGGSGAGSGGVTPGAGRGPSPWLWVSVGLGVLWIATLIGWFLSRRRATSSSAAQRDGAHPLDYGQTPSDKSGTRAAFHAACRENDAAAARRDLLIWANAALPGPRIAGLNDLAKRIK